MTLFGPRVTVFTKDGRQHTREGTGREFIWDFEEHARRMAPITPGLGISPERYEGLVDAIRELDQADTAWEPLVMLTILVFGLMGVLAALAGAIQTARLNAGTNSTGTLAELSVIAAAVIGGASLAGGSGSIPGAFLGAVLMASLINGMLLLDLPSAWQNVVQGLVLVFAVTLDVYVQKRRLK